MNRPWADPNLCPVVPVYPDMNRTATLRHRHSRLLTLTPVYGVPVGLVAAFLVLASARGPAGLANGEAARRQPEPLSLASLVSPADAGPGRHLATPAPAPTAVSAPVSAPTGALAVAPRPRVAPASGARPSAVRRVHPVPAAPPAPIADGLESAVALIGPTIEDLGEPAPDVCAGLAVPIESPRIDAVTECPMKMQVLVNVSAMSSESRHEWAQAIRSAAAHALAAQRARRIAGAI